MKNYDIIIIGGGPAGLTAGIYATRYNLSNLVVTKEIGGMTLEAPEVCNYPSEKSITGFKLIEKIKDNLISLGGEIKQDEVEDVKKLDKDFLLTLESSDKIKAKSIILATGTKKRSLNLKNEKKYLGKGVSYCVTCDGAFFKDKKVAVIGGSDSAGASAVHLSNIAKEVYIIYRGNKLRANPGWKQEIEHNKNIKVLYNTNVLELHGDPMLESVLLDKPYKGEEVFELDGLFIEIGAIPITSLFKDIDIKTNNKNYVMIDEDQSTNIDGVFAAGDVTNGSNGLRQIITACSEGAISVDSAFKYLRAGI